VGFVMALMNTFNGRAVQVHAIKPTLKAPGTKRLKLKCDETLSNFAFKFNLRYYTTATCWRSSRGSR
jgi:hypothetical protein